MKIQIENIHELNALSMMHKMMDDFGFVPVKIYEMDMAVLPADDSLIRNMQDFIDTRKYFLKKNRKK